MERVSDEGGNLWALVGHCRRHASLLPVPVVQRLSRPAKKPESVEAHDAKFLGIRIPGFKAARGFCLKQSCGSPAALISSATIWIALEDCPGARNSRSCAR